MHIDNPLIRASTERITDGYPVPDVEICAQNTTVDFVRCDIIYTNQTVASLSNCGEYIHPGEKDDPASVTQCYMMLFNGSLLYGVAASENSAEITRVDVYWRMADLASTSIASISVPALAIQLFSSQFNPWFKPNEQAMLPQEAQIYRNIQLGNYRSTTMINSTTLIYFSPTTYRAIKPGDFLSLLGFTPKYVDIPMLESTETIWPLHPNAVSTSGIDFHGEFSLQLSAETLNFKTEQRQHSLLDIVALAGGAYGMFSAVYIILFGMLRISPWGLVQWIPVYFYAIVYKSKDFYERYQSSKVSESRRSGLCGIVPLPSFWKRIWHRRTMSEEATQHLCASDSKRYSETSVLTDNDSDLASPSTTHSTQKEQQLSFSDIATVHQDHMYGPTDTVDGKVASVAEKNDSNTMEMMESRLAQSLETADPKSMLAMLINLQRQHDTLVDRASRLEHHVVELENIYRAYYNNMDFLDQQRWLRRRQGRTRVSRYNSMLQPSSIDGWLYDDYVSQSNADNNRQ